MKLPPETEAAAERPPSKDLVITFQGGTLAGQTFEYWNAKRLLIGRSRECDIEVFDTRVSRRHCAVLFDGDRVQVKDLGSANGTSVNGVRVGLAAVESGDVIAVSPDTRFRVEVSDAEKTLELRAGSSSTSGGTRRWRHPDLSLPIPGFELRRLLGEGATSAVLEAKRDDGAIVAVKVLKASDGISPEDRERFFREAEMASQLVHPNIVRVLGRGDIAGRLYTVMELVRGETVKARLARQGALPAPVALHIARQIASALERARTKGIVHRDVKPDNILIQEDGVAKLVDFGLAKVAASEPSGLTRVGDVLGTLAYMAPEQLESSATADHRSDIYSLGASLHHMLAGAVPFTAKTSFEYFEKILHESPPLLTTIRRDVPPIVAGLVARCMRKRPEERPATAEEVVRATTQLLATGFEQRNTVCAA